MFIQDSLVKKLETYINTSTNFCCQMGLVNKLK